VDNIKIGVQNFSHVDGCSEYGNEISGSIKGGS
jgi:hypothetical protein